MELNTKQTVKTLEGVVIKSENREEATIGKFISNALLTSTKPLKGEEHLHRYNLALSVFNSDTVKLTAEEVVLIKNCIAECYLNPLIAGQVIKILES